MFDSLSERLTGSLRAIGGRNRLTDDNIQETLREVRMALLEADVALPVVKDFIEQVRVRAVGSEIGESLTAGQQFVKIVNEELVKIMGDANVGLDLKTQPPAIILLAGLQGAGKTTSAAKLARHLKERENKRVLMVSADVYRPAAIDQLQTLSEQVGVDFFPTSTRDKPVKIAKRALKEARSKLFDVLIVDTAGRLAIDKDMMDEIKAVHKVLTPIETLFVVDSMTGQDAANTAKAFHDALPLSGVILTKTDGDARGGAALSIRHITGKPIKFLGVGEKTEALEPFHPDRLASRILGMGDVLSLIEDVERKVDKKKAEKLARKVVKGNKFTLQDMQDQLEQIQNMGNIGDLLGKLPGMAGMADKVADKVNDKDIKRQVAIIQSMTPKEKRFPDLIRGTRKRRIAKGAGLDIPDVNRVLKQYKQMERMMKKMGGKKMQNMMRGMGGMMGGQGPGPGGMGGLGGPGGGGNFPGMGR